MLSATQLEQMKAAMLEEHRKDLEALKRLERFLPASLGLTNGHSSVPHVTDSPSEFFSNGYDQSSLIDAVFAVLGENPDVGWTAPALVERLRKDEFQLGAAKPQPSVSVALKKLTEREKIYIARRGSGRTPHVYKLKKEPVQTSTISP